MNYKQYNLEELYGMFDKEQNPEGLNKIMSVVADKQGILSDGYEEPKNAQLEEEIFEQQSCLSKKILMFFC